LILNQFNGLNIKAVNKNIKNIYMLKLQRLVISGAADCYIYAHTSLYIEALFFVHGHFFINKRIIKTLRAVNLLRIQ
jgi:hypothetical protein